MTLLGGLSIGIVGGCSGRDSRGGLQQAAGSASASSSVDSYAMAAASAYLPEFGDDSGWKACEQRRVSLMKEPALAGAAVFEAKRAELVGRVRGMPVMWRRVPSEPSELPVGASKDWEAFLKAENPLGPIRNLVHTFERKPEALRSIILREGYVFSDDVERALAMVETLRLTNLFREQTIYLQRGASLHKLKLVKKDHAGPERYVHEDGPLSGYPAEFLLGDRFALDPESLSKDIATIDFEQAEQKWGFDRVRPIHLTATSLVADLRYGSDTWLPAVLDISQVSASVACHAADPSLALKASKYRGETDRFRQAIERIKKVVKEEVDEQIPFDVPRGGGEGAANGSVRPAWEASYLEGIRSFPFGGKRYQVYDHRGRPIPPQVCIDFILDTWERASGTWYRGMVAKKDGGPLEPSPAKIAGNLNLEGLGLENRRSVAEFVRLTKLHTLRFDVWDVPAADRVPFSKRSDFFSMLVRHADDILEGDLLVIHGFKHGGRPHYHSVMVLEKDPITGIPTLVAGNAARPREQTLEGVMQISPQRSIKHRIRPRPGWLVEIILGGKKKK